MQELINMVDTTRLEVNLIDLKYILGVKAIATIFLRIVK